MILGMSIRRRSDRRSDNLRGAWPSSGEKVSPGRRASLISPKPAG